MKNDVYVIFKSPKTHPNKYTVQKVEFDGGEGRPGKVLAAYDTLQEARKMIPQDCFVIHLNDDIEAHAGRAIEIHECHDEPPSRGH